MKKFANKGKVNKLEKSLSSRLNKMSENLTRNTNMIGNSKVKLEEVVSSLAALQSNFLVPLLEHLGISQVAMIRPTMLAFWRNSMLQGKR